MPTAAAHHSFQYVECDLADGATLRQWRHEQELGRRAELPRPSPRFPSLRMPRVRVRFA
jgi:hypothetical protein